MKIVSALRLLAFAAVLSICACPARDASMKGNTQGTAAAEESPESKGPDPRAAFESSGLLGGISALPESPVALIAASGIPEAGVSLALGGALSMAAIARRSPSPGAEGRFDHELVLASGARAALPGPSLALASTGERILVACARGSPSARASLICFKAEGEGENLAPAWRSEGPPAKRLLAVPGGRVAVADEAAGLYVVDASTGAQAWSKTLPVEAADIAYAPGIILAASGSSLEAFDESTGASAWTAALTAKARSISAGNGVALVLADSGSLSVFSLIDGRGIGAAPGPFDPALRPIAEGSSAIVALLGGGASEIDAKSGQTLRGWAWEGRSSFIAADRERVYAGVDGRLGRGILISPRAGEEGRRLAELDAPAFDSAQAVTGTRGGLLLLLMDGSLVLAGKDRDSGSAASILDAAISPPAETAAAIGSALGRFSPSDKAEPGQYFRFDLFAQGMPVDTGINFTAFRYRSDASARRKFFAKPSSGGSIVAIYDESGHEIAASIDELGSSSIAAAYLEKGRVYWITAGWSYQATPESFRLYIK
jgi:hypothetical protein